MLHPILLRIRVAPQRGVSAVARGGRFVVEL
jgi:hypothetical protein